MNIGKLAHVHERHIVLVYVADNPHFRQIGNGEKIRRIVQGLHACRSCYLLIGDDA